MIYLAYRNLFQSKTRLILSLGGVALSIMLIIFLNGFLNGIYEQVTAYLDHTPTDWIVAQEGVSNLLGATSLLPVGTEGLAQEVPGIDSVIPIVAQYIILDIHDEKVVGYMVGYDPDLGGGPWSMAEGRPPKTVNEIVLDRVMAADHGLAVSDTITILDKEFNIVGLSKDTSSWMANFLFLTKDAVDNLLLAPNATSFLLVTAPEGANPARIEQQLREHLPDVEIVTSEEARQNDLDLLVKIFSVPLQMMVSIAFTVGTAVLGLIIYTATISRAREYGVLKAVGITNAKLAGLVLIQALFISILGVGLGFVLAQAASSWIMAAYPKFLISISPNNVLPTIGAGIAMGLLSAFLPARYLGQLDPAQIFRK